MLAHMCNEYENIGSWLCPGLIPRKSEPANKLGYEKLPAKFKHPILCLGTPNSNLPILVLNCSQLSFWFRRRGWGLCLRHSATTRSE